MSFERRHIIKGAGALMLMGTAGCAPQKGTKNMYGLIAKTTASSGQADTLAEIMLTGLKNMPGCLSYIISKDAGDDDVLWIHEVWTDAAAHKASLGLESVQAAIGKARPLIAGMERVAELSPIGGEGLK